MVALSPAHPQSLTAESHRVLARLAGASFAPEVYLAGSAALALYLGHRPVRELDLMSATNRLAPADRRDLLAEVLALFAGSQVETARDGYFFASLEGVGLRIHYYPYPLVEPPAEVDGLAVASAVDLGLMKLGAIISRGTRRDFLDLYLLCRQLPLATLLDAASGKFGHVRDFTLQALKGLVDFSQVAGEPMPRLARPVTWEEVESWALAEVRSLSEAFTGAAP
ncbi:MAG: nucleotidyl transferase AbiEii/AbiGii toxin family protein [Thermoanaerobaculia bacterium]